MKPPSRPGRALDAIVALASIAALGGCAPDPMSTLGPAVMETYAEIVHASYEDAHSAAVRLQAAIVDFVSAPSPESHARAKTAWLAAREPYGQTEAYRFGGGPIDREGGPEGFLNAWPLDEGHVDYVQGDPRAGIVNRPDLHPTIDRELLISLNESGAEENVSTGFHAIEFLLWGQDLSADGAGARAYTDYLPGAAPNADRRGRYLVVASELLVEQLEGLLAEWAPGRSDNHRARWAAAPTAESIRAVLAGIGVLAKSELAGERIFTAYDNQDQEDEHSCFSDNTHRDIVANATGIRNVLRGRYVRVDGSVVEGTGVLDLVGSADPALAAEIRTLADRSLALVEAIPAPFDRAIVDPDSRPRVLEAVYALQDLGDRIAAAGSALGLTINTALPN